MVGVRVVLAVVALALAACSGDGSEPRANPPTAAPAAIGPAVTAAPTMPVLVEPVAPSAAPDAAGEASAAQRTPPPNLPPVAPMPRLAALPSSIPAPEDTPPTTAPPSINARPPIVLQPPPASPEAAETAAAAAELRARALEAFDGRWRPVLQLSGSDERCSRLLSVATFGPFTIERGAVSGTIAVPRGGNYAVSGSVGGDGRLVDVRAVGSRSTITFTGQLSGSSGSGDWAGSRCSGSWSMSRSS